MAVKRRRAGRRPGFGVGAPVHSGAIGIEQVRGWRTYSRSQQRPCLPLCRDCPVPARQVKKPAPASSAMFLTDVVLTNAALSAQLGDAHTAQGSAPRKRWAFLWFQRNSGRRIGVRYRRKGRSANTRKSNRRCTLFAPRFEPDYGAISAVAVGTTVEPPVQRRLGHPQQPGRLGLRVSTATGN